MLARESLPVNVVLRAVQRRLDMHHIYGGPTLAPACTLALALPKDTPAQTAGAGSAVPVSAGEDLTRVTSEILRSVLGGAGRHLDKQGSRSPHSRPGAWARGEASGEPEASRLPMVRGRSSTLRAGSPRIGDRISNKKWGRS